MAGVVRVMYYRSLNLLLSVALLTSCAGFTPASKVSPGKSGAALSAGRQGEDFTQAGTWILGLNSSDEGEREAAKGKLTSFAAKSPEARRYVIKEALRIADVGDRAGLERHRARILEWKGAVDILGALKATEAVGVLVDCLDCNHGPTGLGTDRYPAATALIKIGEEAVPKLDEALQRRSKGISYMAAQTLYGIGGGKAKEVLEKAALRSKDRQFVTIIRDLLRNWDGSGKSVTYSNYKSRLTDATSSSAGIVLMGLAHLFS